MFLVRQKSWILYLTAIRVSCGGDITIVMLRILLRGVSHLLCTYFITLVIRSVKSEKSRERVEVASGEFGRRESQRQRSLFLSFLLNKARYAGRGTACFASRRVDIKVDVTRECR